MRIRQQNKRITTKKKNKNWTIAIFRVQTIVETVVLSTISKTIVQTSVEILVG